MIAVYIDVQNTHMRTLEQGWRIDREKLFVYLTQNCDAEKIYYAVGYRREFQDLYSKLEQIGYTMLFKKTLVLPNGEVKGNVDIDIAIKVIVDRYEGVFSRAYLITNDGDYNTLVDFLREKGVFGHLITPNFRTAGTLLKQAAGKYIRDIQRIRHLIELIDKTKKP